MEPEVMCAYSTNLKTPSALLIRLIILRGDC